MFFRPVIKLIATRQNLNSGRHCVDLAWAGCQITVRQSAQASVDSHLVVFVIEIRQRMAIIQDNMKAALQCCCTYLSKTCVTTFHHIYFVVFSSESIDQTLTPCNHCGRTFMPETLVSSLVKEPVYFYEREDHDIIVQSS